jgi:hypothetical protein
MSRLTGKLFEIPFDPRRRVLLRAGVPALLLLYGIDLLQRPARAATAGSTWLWMQAEDAVLVQRVVPVLLAGALPAGAARERAIEDVVRGVDFAIAYFSPAVRGEIRQLFSLLRNPISRALLAGVWGGWAEASDTEVRAFLDRWRQSRFDLLRSAYVALHDLVAGAWYGNAASWRRIGYPGPPALKGVDR